PYTTLFRSLLSGATSVLGPAVASSMERRTRATASAAASTPTAARSTAPTSAPSFWRQVAPAHALLHKRLGAANSGPSSFLRASLPPYCPEIHHHDSSGLAVIELEEPAETRPTGHFAKQVLQTALAKRKLSPRFHSPSARVCPSAGRTGFADCDCHFDRATHLTVSGVFSRTSGSRTWCAPTEAK